MGDAHDLMEPYAVYFEGLRKGKYDLSCLDIDMFTFLAGR